jgi:hypothetical protein
MSDSDRRITEELAKRLWERAAQIQAEAAQREEDRLKEEASGESSQKLLPGETDDGEGYSLTHVRQAGLEVGIQPEFLDLALGEDVVLELEGGSKEGSFDRAAKRLLGDHRRALEFHKSFSFPARPVWLSLEDTLISDPNNFDLLEVRGEAPAEGGVAIFEAPYVPRNDGSLRYWSAAADTKRYLVRVTPNAGGDRCEVLIRVPLRRSRRIAGGLGAGMVSGLGILGGWAGLGIAGVIAGTGGMATIPLALLLGGGAVGGAAGVGGLTRFVLKHVYRAVFRGLERSVERLFTHVERELERESSLR